MSECCGKTITSKFCPDCGSPAMETPAHELLNHCRKRAKAAAATAAKMSRRSNDANITHQATKEHYAKVSEANRKLSARWNSWGDALQRLMEGP
jgi:DNA-directed RNA polymerase subunit M/transcription elongation factor TFIIS